MIHTRPPLRPSVPPGGAPVGHVADLPAFEATALALVRLWQAGHVQQLGAMFHSKLGPCDGDDAIAALDDLMRFIGVNGRRPLAFHHPDCTCFGGDESALTRLIAAAASGHDEEAALLALHLVPAQHPDRLVHQAAWAGAAIFPLAELAAAATQALTATRH